MKPGREMDRLVAKEVMGWEFDVPANRGGECQNCGGRWGDAPSHGRRKPLDNEWYRWCDGNACRYSTSDAAAKAVVWAMWEKGYMVEMVDHGSNYVRFMLHWADPSETEGKGSADGPSFPMAVCVAALRALGVDCE